MIFRTASGGDRLWYPEWSAGQGRAPTPLGCGALSFTARGKPLASHPLQGRVGEGVGIAGLGGFSFVQAEGHEEIVTGRTLRYERLS